MHCQHECHAAANFCEACGSPLDGAAHARDPAWHAPLSGHRPRDGEARFAREAIEDRRQATVLFADISGYTAQCACSDPEHVQAMLERFYAGMDHVVNAYGGSVFDRIGDCVMAVFGAPVAHGNDPERALRAAFDMHATAARLPDACGRPLVLHIGAARGEVAALMRGNGAHAAYSVTGDAVNLAARLGEAAGAGETLVPGPLYQAVAGIVEAEALGPTVVHGFARPVSVWRLHGVRCTAAPLSSFVGRESDLARFFAVLDAVRTGERGAVVIVRGNAGIGKTRLVAEVRARAAAQGFATPLQPVLDFGVARGQSAMPALLRSLLGIDASCGEASARETLDAALRDADIDPARASFLHAMLELEPAAGARPLQDALDNATRSAYEAHAITTLVARLARRTRLLVTIEDVHWASPELLHQLHAVARAALGAPLALVMTTRIESDPFDQAWRDELTGAAAVVLDLAPLSHGEAALMTSGWLDAGSDVAQRCIARAEGNPLFLEQLLKAHVQGGLDDVPPTVQSVVMERVDRLSEAERVLLRAASVIGRRFTYAELQGLAAADDKLRAAVVPPGILNPDDDDACLSIRTLVARLVATDIIRPDDDGTGFRFTHALIHEAVYASVLRSRRRQLHLCAARNTADDDHALRAEHLERAADAEAAQQWLLAGRHELEQARVETALAFARRGMACATDRSVRCRLALLAAESLRELGQSDESIAGFEEALSLATHDIERCHAWMGAAADYRVKGDIVAALDALSHAQPIAVANALTVECSQIHNLRGNLHYARGDVPACEAEHLLALDHARAANHPACEVRALSGLGDARLEQGKLAAALESFRDCVSICAARRWIGMEIPNRCMFGHCLRYAGLLAQALDETLRALSDARKVGLVPAQVFAAMTLATVQVDAGDIDGTEETCRDGLPLARRAGARRFEASLLTSLADVQLRQGRREEARASAMSALRLASDTGLGFAGAAIHGMLARTARDAAEREAALSEGEALLREPCLAHSVLRFHTNAIEACLESGQWHAALRYAQSLQTFVGDDGLPLALLIAARARALCSLALDDDLLAAGQRLLDVRRAFQSAGIGSGLPAIDEALAKLRHRRPAHVPKQAPKRAAR
ncbi:adenylate/guanylate cyclase domain-containing protein [Caballeronia sp. ATUFL_M2_KS44]|uniref:adenylate/guanylate cyclase domain-containing protein n=1 Tax=Caballeronia sp. ATUFL_M2_KS44 TaxID=2921767 RepID=UPI002027BCE8|nr:adenylate/guanylate cyclase domain-containing protein [Caballeronia sp. ATUFL_M2_KS44]